MIPEDLRQELSDRTLRRAMRKTCGILDRCADRCDHMSEAERAALDGFWGRRPFEQFTEWAHVNYNHPTPGYWNRSTRRSRKAA